MKYLLRHYSARPEDRYLAGAFLLGAIVALAWLCILFNNNSSALVGIEPQTQRVSIARPVHRQLNVTATLSGIWVAREEVVIGSPLEGVRIAEVLVESGERVVSGQLLALLDHAVLDTQTRQTDQAVRRALSEFDHANEQYLRARRLMPAGAVSRQDFEAIRATMLAAQAELQRAKAASEEQRIRQKQAEIRAPFPGMITRRSAQAGAMVGVQTPLFHLASEPSEFEVQVPQQLLPDLIVGMKAKVSTTGRNGVQSGSLRLISAVVDASTGYGKARIAMTEQNPAQIRPGTVGSARVEINVKDVLAIDARALRFSATPYVFVVDNGLARRTPVTIGLRQQGWVEVVTGLNSASRVVSSGSSLLQDGDPVNPSETDSTVVPARQPSFSLSVSTLQEAIGVSQLSAGGKA